MTFEFKYIATFTILLISLLGCGSSSDSGEDDNGSDMRSLLGVPENFELPPIPEFNPPTKEKIELGRHLFYDQRLSMNGSQSCASCHQQDRAFTDGLPRSIGSTGGVHPRNSQGLGNAMYHASLTWSNDGFIWLEDQIEVPLINDNPVELGISDGARDEVFARFSNDPLYQNLFSKAFVGSTEVSLNKIIFALASFCRTLITGNSDFDRYARGDSTALSDQQKLGLTLFNGERFECFHCHTGINFTVSYRDANSKIEDVKFPFFNTGLYNVGGTGNYPVIDQGLYELTLDLDDRGLFRPQSLRNIELTAPYMHDGSLKTLEEVVEHYARGGTLTTSGPNAGDGRLSPLKSGLVRGFAASPEEKAAVVAFLKSLTDWEFIDNPNHSDPFVPRPSIR